MTRIAVIFAATVSVVVLLFSYHTSTHPDALAATPRTRVPTGSPVPNPSSDPATPSGSPTTGNGAGGGSGNGSGTFDGGAADTPYGPVQVRITMAGGRITNAQTVQVPAESRRDVQINNYAVPVLVQETLQAQSSQIDTVSGATYTSEGYIQSLQSAIDAAHK